MSQGKDQREWARMSWKSLPARRAEELEALCEAISKDPMRSDKDSCGQLRTLCRLTLGTESLKEHIQELLESLLKTNRLKRLPRLLLVNVEKKSFGLFNHQLAQEQIKEYERIQILIKQPIGIRKALQRGDTEKATYLRLRTERWKEQFEKLYGEPVDHEVNTETVTQEINRLTESRERRNEGSPS